MSEIAVKIYEQKRHIQRYRIAEPVYGAKGPDQRMYLVDAGTNEPVRTLSLPQCGYYTFKSAWMGEKLNQVSLQMYPPSTTFCKSHSSWADNNRLYERNVLVFIPEPISEPFDESCCFANLLPETVISYFYLVITYCDE